MPESNDTTAKAIRDTLISPNEADRNLEPANVVDGLYAVMRSMRFLGKAIGSTERTVNGTEEITQPLADAIQNAGEVIADALSDIAAAIRETHKP